MESSSPKQGQHSSSPRGTYSKVVPKQLHDEGAVFVRLFIQRVQLCYRFIKCLKIQKTELSHCSLNSLLLTQSLQICHVTIQMLWQKLPVFFCSTKRRSVKWALDNQWKTEVLSGFQMKAQNNFTAVAIWSTEEASTLYVALKNDSHSLKSGSTTT